MVYGELGRFPISVNIKVRMISFWCKLIKTQGDKLSSHTFCLLRNYNNQWYNFIKSILNECGLSYIWQTGQSVNTPWLKKLFLTLCMISLNNCGIAICLTPQKELIIEYLRLLSVLKAIYRIYLLNI